jgi:hypothetical protein
MSGVSTRQRSRTGPGPLLTGNSVFATPDAVPFRPGARALLPMVLVHNLICHFRYTKILPHVRAKKFRQMSISKEKIPLQENMHRIALNRSLDVVLTSAIVLTLI